MMRSAVFGCVLAAFAVAGTSAAADKAGQMQKNAIKLQSLGTSSLTPPNPNAPLAILPDTREGPNEYREDREKKHQEIMRELTKRLTAQAAAGPKIFATIAPPTIPTVSATPFDEQEGETNGFPGITNFQQRNAGTGVFANTQFTLEPPDQALCVGGGYVVEMVNLAVVVYDTRGNLLAGPTPINQFFHLSPAYTRSNPPVFGEFTSDPKCLYDAATNRWFATVTETDTDGVTNNVMIAASATNDPRGLFNVYKLNVTLDGDSGFCSFSGCFGDQPLIGVDANGFYVSTNSFSFFFEGAQLYALSKTQLLSGAGVSGVHFGGLSFLIPGLEVAYSLQPANTPPGDQGEPGTQYFLQSQRALGIERGLIVWAIGNTAALNSANPLAITLDFRQIDSQQYAFPMPSQQRPGPTPFGELDLELGDLENLNADDHRMQQVMFSRGNLYSALTTSARMPGAPLRNAIAWFVVSVSNSGGLQASVRDQGYLGAGIATHMMYPSLGVNAQGHATMVFSVSGYNRFPSVGLWRMGAESLTIARGGTRPEDGFSGYFYFPAFTRWGDYSAAAVDDWGRIWFAAEYINSSPRTADANWATFVGVTGW